jgi:hypothetical protein
VLDTSVFVKSNLGRREYKEGLNSSMTPARDRGVLELHDDAPKRVTTQTAVIAKTEMVKGFHAEP